MRRVRDAFKENKSLTDLKLIRKEYQFAKDNFEIITRQVGKTISTSVMFINFFLRFSSKSQIAKLMANWRTSVQLYYIYVFVRNNTLF